MSGNGGNSMKAADGVQIAEPKRYDFRMGDGEFDELFLTNATIHIERMDTTAFWIGIEPEGMSGLMVNTGVHRGTWYFNLEVDTIGDDHGYQQVQRPRGATVETQKYVRDHIAQQDRITSLESDLSRAEERERVLREALKGILDLFTEEPLMHLRPNDPGYRMTNGDSDRVDDAFIAADAAITAAPEQPDRGVCPDCKSTTRSFRGRRGDEHGEWVCDNEWHAPEQGKEAKS